MKMTKKKVFVAALAICLIAIMSVGTLAWFQAKDTVTNIFQVSTDNETQNADFKITLFETEVNPETNGFGDADGDGQIEEVKTNTYDNVAPGDVLPKDPTVRNEGEYDQWVRMNVTISNIDEWQAVLGTDFNFRTLFNISTAWSFDKVEKNTTAKTLTLVYYLDSKLTVGNSSAVLFDKVTIPREFEVDNIPTNFNINVVADAIQADNTGTNAKSAFENYWKAE
jgi:predicted ribosomally synthesized peptide with SipW-like signal peptide